jgi:hypothetical protein
LIASGRAPEGEPMLIAAYARLLATVGKKHEAAQQAGQRLAEYFRVRHRDDEAARVLAGTYKR